MKKKPLTPAETEAKTKRLNRLALRHWDRFPGLAAACRRLARTIKRAVTGTPPMPITPKE